jgi:DNA mismatch repair protein PMS2
LLFFPDAIHCLGVKFNLFDISSTDNEELRLSTMCGSTKLEQTMSSVLGSKYLSAMSRISIDLPIDDTVMWGVEGLISKAPNLTKDGFQARNAQFFCINGRPVELPKISKTLSEAWRTLEGTTKKKPACVLHFTLPKNSYDVNLSPDKRQVLLNDEKRICELVYEGVLSFWTGQRDGKFLQNELEEGQQSVDVADFAQDDSMKMKVKRRMAFVNDFRTVKLQHDSETDHLQGSSSHSVSSRLTPPPEVTPTQRDAKATERDDKAVDDSTSKAEGEPFELLVESETVSAHRERPTDHERRLWSEAQQQFLGRRSSDEIEQLENVASPLNNEISEGIEEQVKFENVSFQQATTVADQATVEERSIEILGIATERLKRKAVTMQDFGFIPVENQKAGQGITRVSKINTSPSEDCESVFKGKILEMKSVSKKVKSISTEVKMVSIEIKSASESTLTSPHKRPLLAPMSDGEFKIPESAEVAAGEAQSDEDDLDEPQEARTVVWDAFQGADSVIQASRQARLDLEDRRKKLKLVKEERKRSHNEEPSKQEQEKGKIVSLAKDHFREMEVIGQFNLGFILAIRDDNLWILDQHACDEKYNFERLCANTVIQEQRLIAPMPLELTPAEEACILDNMEIFQSNGFRFAHDPSKPPRHRLSLTALPHSGARDGCKAVQFGKDDVSALCAILGVEGGSSFSQAGGTGVDGSGMYGNNAVRRYAGASQLSQNGEKIMARLPKAVAMFANRACRGSVMIGTALSKREMEQIVERLASVDHPWNCPHGRPTIKHVKDLLPNLSKDEKRSLALAVGPTVSMPEMTQEEGPE